jgi:Putative DNA-binding domain
MSIIMYSLNDAQAIFIETLNKGPDRLDPCLFAGPPDRVLLGLKAHANTINHARIVALEDTFPLTRQHLGDAAFNMLAREFIETDIAKASDANNIGRNFPDMLSDPVTTELARIEWAWLESYHAAEAEPLSLADLGGLDEASLLALPVAPHPSARFLQISVPLAAALNELAGTCPAAILSIRPATEVRLVPLETTEAAVFSKACEKNATMGNLLTAVIEQSGDTDPLGPVMTLIGAGALITGG